MTPAVTLPPELQALITQIDACEAEAERLVVDLDDDGVNWTPPPSKQGSRWSVAQCLMHLVLMNELYLRAWPESVAEATAAARGPFTGLRPTPFGRWFARSLEPPARFKSKAIAAVTPAERFPRAGLVEQYRRSHDIYRRLVQSSAAVDVNRIVRPNAIIKSVKMRLATVLLIIPAHDRRHLWQAANVKRARAGG
jgi:DinB superfamily